MVSCCRRPSRMVGGSITLEIAASPCIVWETITDTENATKILTNLLELQVISDDKEEEVGVGAVVREVRMWSGRTTESYRTITSITTTDSHYSISTNVYLTRSHALSGMQKAARTGSWTIVEGKDQKSSVFVWTYSAIPEGWCESLATLCCGRFIIRTISKHFEQDLQDFSKEAERRQVLKDSCSNNNAS